MQDKVKGFLSKVFKLKDVKEYLSLHKTLEASGRSPIHMAAASGNPSATKWAFDCLSEEDEKNAINMAGKDGMSPLHLATIQGNSAYVTAIIDKQQIQTTIMRDFLGREALHLAASYRRDEIAALLLKQNSQPDTVDEIGKTPLDYLLKGDQDITDPDEDVEGYDTGAKTEDSQRSEISQRLRNLVLEVKTQHDKRLRDTLVESKRKMFAQFALKKHDKTGKTFLHFAVEHADLGTVRRLLKEHYDIECRDANGRTPLRSAIIAGRS